MQTQVSSATPKSTITRKNIAESTTFSTPYYDLIKIIEFFNNEETNVNGDYVSTCNYINMDNNSLNRYYNFSYIYLN